MVAFRETVADAVAVGMGPLAHGNDQGGSIRYPAYACGVYGLRPSVGRVAACNASAAAERPPIVGSTSVQGPLARCVADLRLSLDAMARRDLRDPASVPVSGASQRAGAGLPRVALCTVVDGLPCDEAVRAATLLAARWLQDAGHVVEDVQPPALREAAARMLPQSTTLRPSLQVMVLHAVLRCRIAPGV